MQRPPDQERGQTAHQHLGRQAGGPVLAEALDAGKVGVSRCFRAQGKARFKVTTTADTILRQTQSNAISGVLAVRDTEFWPP